MPNMNSNYRHIIGRIANITPIGNEATTTRYRISVCNDYGLYLDKNNHPVYGKEDRKDAEFKNLQQDWNNFEVNTSDKFKTMDKQFLVKGMLICVNIEAYASAPNKEGKSYLNWRVCHGEQVYIPTRGNEKYFSN